MTTARIEVPTYMKRSPWIVFIRTVHYIPRCAISSLAVSSFICNHCIRIVIAPGQYIVRPTMWCIVMFNVDKYFASCPAFAIEQHYRYMFVIGWKRTVTLVVVVVVCAFFSVQKIFRAITDRRRAFSLVLLQIKIPKPFPTDIPGIIDLRQFQIAE